MYKITALRKRLEEFDNNYQLELDKLVLSKENVSEMTRMNEEQLSNSIRTDGQKIVPIYSLGYQRRMRKRSQYPNLYVSGALYKNINVMHVDSGYLFYSSVNYSRYLENRYATRKAHIYGLTDANFNIIRRKILTQFRKNVLSV